jgi:hypothetical protein
MKSMQKSEEIKALETKLKNLIKEKDKHVKNQKYDLAVEARDEFNEVAKELDQLKSRKSINK